MIFSLEVVKAFLPLCPELFILCVTFRSQLFENDKPPKQLFPTPSSVGFET